MIKAIRNTRIFFLLIVSISLYFFIQQNLSLKREVYLEQSYMDYTLPSKISGIVAMEFKGIVSDFLFLKVSTFLGDKFMNNEKLEKKHADYIYNSVDIITDLDPWFWDAYLFSNMLLAWDFRQIDLANKLLFKAREYRKDDFKVPYHIGFNYFYFLKDNINGAKYIMEAAKLPDSPTYLPSLASRLFMYQNQYKPAILFLKDILKQTRNPALVKQFELRVKTLIILQELENAVQKFNKKYGSYPLKVEDLIEQGFIKTMPNDPYGGKFVIMENGRVLTSSNMVYKSKNPK